MDRAAHVNPISFGASKRKGAAPKKSSQFGAVPASPVEEPVAALPRENFNEPAIPCANRLTRAPRHKAACAAVIDPAQLDIETWKQGFEASAASLLPQLRAAAPARGAQSGSNLIEVLQRRRAPVQAPHCAESSSAEPQRSEIANVGRALLVGMGLSKANTVDERPETRASLPADNRAEGRANRGAPAHAVSALRARTESA